MSVYNFTDPKTGRSYTVNAPASVTADQAEAIFRQQLDGGGLSGFNIGQALNSATQTASGLLSALPNLQQTVARLPIGTNLNTITSVLGPGAGAANSQLQSSLQGQGFPIATNVATGATGLGAAVAQAASSAVKTASDAISRVSKALTGAAASAGSLANTAVRSLTSSLQRTTVTNGINTADLIKQGTETAIPGLSAANTQAAMAQASRLVNQSASVLSNTMGVGKFGLSMPQLERAGYLKPGTTAGFGDALPTSVLGSSMVWTGKDGVKSIDSVLGNPGLQNSIQKNLMTQGLTDLKTVGVPVGQMTPQAVAGLANNAAISVTDTLKSLQNAPDLSVAAKSNFDTVARDTAYAVDYAEEKVDIDVLGETSPEAVENTVDTETLDAATERIVGNSKVPDTVSDIP